TLGIRAQLPIALYADGTGTLPHAPLPASKRLCCASATSRAVRLASVIIAWNVIQHFYPYFEVIKTDWNAELPKALRTAATDDTRGFEKTLRRLMASLKDGHAGVVPWAAGMRNALFSPVTMEWVQGDFILTRVPDNAPEGVARGDRVLAIDGKPIA